MKKGSEQHLEQVWRRGIELTPQRELVFSLLEKNSNLTPLELKQMDVSLEEVHTNTINTWKQRFLRKKKNSSVVNNPVISMQESEKLVTSYLNQYVSLREENRAMRLKVAQLKNALDVSESLNRELRNKLQQIQTAGRKPVEALRGVLAEPGA